MSHKLHADDMRDRLIRFYNHYHAPGLRLVDHLLHVYCGREDELMLVLEDKYGPEPVQTRLTHSGEDVGCHSSSLSDLNALVVRLSASLKRKNTETARLVAQIKSLQNDLSAAHENATHVHQRAVGGDAALRTQNDALQKQLRHLTLENEVMCQERHQLMQDLRTSAQQNAALQKTIGDMRVREEDLLVEVAELRLRVEQPTGKDEFTTLIQDCRGRLRDHFEARVAKMEEEMARYYKYAEKQVCDRDATIELLKRVYCASPAELSDHSTGTSRKA